MNFSVHPLLHQVRVDSGIQEGSDISIYYDPMISKVSRYLVDLMADVWLMFSDKDSHSGLCDVCCSWSHTELHELRRWPGWRMLWITM